VQLHGPLTSCVGVVFCVCRATQSLRSPSAQHAALTTGHTGRRILSVGDLHGDARHAAELLRALGVMDEQGNWAGGEAVLVQTGDIVDRGDHSRRIYEMLFQLQDQAPEHGGEVVLLLGNHELMHMQGDTRYMTEEDAAEFGGAASCEAAFGPDGWLGARLRRRGQTAALLGPEHGLAEPVVYVHAGIVSSIASSYGVKAPALIAQQGRAGGKASQASEAGARIVAKLNEGVRSLLSGRGESELSSEHSVLFGDSGPLWTRKLALGEDPCEDLHRTLTLLNATRMVVGHTAQTDGRVHHRCGGRLVLADTLISEAYSGTSHPSAVEVTPNGCAYALYPVRGDRQELPCLAGA